MTDAGRDNPTWTRLQNAWRECNRHLHHMQYALNAIEGKRPLTGEALQSLDDESIQDLDQFELRFGRLQDAMAARLLPAVLDWLQEPHEDRPMRDKLNRLQELGFLASIEQWQNLRAIRDRFDHDSPDDHDQNAAFLNLAMGSVAELLDLLDRIGGKLELPRIEAAR